MDISAATMASIGPAMSFFFGFGFLAITAGAGSPLTIVAAIVTIALPGNTLAQFSRAQPPTVVVVIYACILNSRDPELADRVGSLAADE